MNLGYIALLVALRRQIFVKVTHFERHSWTAAIETPLPDGEKAAAAPPTPRPRAMSLMPSRVKIRAMASDDEDHGHRVETARQIQTMQKAER